MDIQSVIDRRRNDLMRALIPWREHLAAKGYPLRAMRLTEAYPGDSTTSFNLRVSADWIGSSKSKALDVLFDAMWEVVPQHRRAEVHAVLAYTTGQDIMGSVYAPPPVPREEELYFAE